MKKLTKAALAATLIAGTSSFAIVMPANAKKEEKAAPGPQLGKEIRPLIIAAQTAMDAKDYATVETNLTAAEAVAKTNDEKYYTQVLRLQLKSYRLGANDTENSLAPELDQLLANPGTPTKEVGRFNFIRANIYYNNKQYPQAVASYTKARELGYANPDLNMRLARSKIYGGDTTGGVADIEAQIAADKAAGKPIPEDTYKYTIVALQKTTDTAATQRWTRDWLYAFPTQKNWHTAIYVFGFQGANAKTITKRQRVDLFRLLRATKALAGQNEYLEYAQLAVDVGVATESQSVIAEGKANTNIPAANADAKLISTEAARQIALEGALAAQQKRAAATSDGLEAAGVGDYALGTGNYAVAIEMYKLSLSKGGAKVDPDEVNTHLGIAYLASGDKAQAKVAFGAVKNGLRAQIASLWMTWVDAPGATTA